MRVFLAGATGFIGQHLLRGLAERGHAVTCLARGAGAASIRAMALPGVGVLEGEFTLPESYHAHLAGHDVVINAVGIIRETVRSRFDIVHTQAPIALFEAARSAGVRKIIQISALGADNQATSRYHLSKRAADRRLAELGVAYVVLRPSFVYGPGDHSMTFFQSLAALPITPVPGDGQYRVQPVHVDDVVRAVVQAVERDGLREVMVDVGGAVPITFDALLDTVGTRLGKGRVWKVHIPWTVMTFAASVTDMLGGRGPITSEELAMLLRGNWTDNGPFIKLFGFEPMAFAVGMARKPIGEAERWHARLTHLRLPLRLSIAFIWLATGFISATVSRRQGFDLLEQIGITGPLANLALYGTALLEIAIGMATAVGWYVRWMGGIQIALMLGFMTFLTAGIPELWLHPFGPLTKNIPLIAATCVMMALEE
ncbi:hypothetical protein AYO44_03740 [Planctomycetaceae bacterium SCGC AG-212-F19]|nr:hypothetical protein AYO44_03740 [Planctomycetaceae bacterium SCGC AG-212-F19]